MVSHVLDMWHIWFLMNPLYKTYASAHRFLTDQLEHHNVGGCTDYDFTLTDGTVKAVGKGSLLTTLTTLYVGSDRVYL